LARLGRKRRDVIEYEDNSRSMLTPVVRRLGALAALKSEQAAQLTALCRRAESHAAGATLVKEGEPSVRPRFVTSGWACRQRILSDGRRQIFNLVLPGDTIGCGRLSRLSPPTASTVALTRVAVVDAAAATDAVEGLGEVFDLSETRDQTVLLNHIMRLGRQTAYERVAHLLLEIGERLSIAGAGEPNHFPMPVTQDTLADVLGLSVVHINRTLQQLRRERLIEFTGGAVTLLDPEFLASIADYSPLKS
jgi:CRP-like cAMP-binding protein